MTRVTLAKSKSLQGHRGVSFSSVASVSPPHSISAPERRPSLFRLSESTAIFNVQWNIYPLADTWEKEDVQSQQKHEERARDREERKPGKEKTWKGFKSCEHRILTCVDLQKMLHNDMFTLLYYSPIFTFPACWKCKMVNM